MIYFPIKKYTLFEPQYKEAMLQLGKDPHAVFHCVKKAVPSHFKNTK